MNIPVQITSRVWEETLEGGGEAVLLCQSALPILSRSDPKPCQRINRYYERLEECFQRWCRERLAPEADALRTQARNASRPFEPWRARLCFESREEDGLLHIETRYVRSNGEAALYSARRWEVWDLLTGLPERKSIVKTP